MARAIPGYVSQYMKIFEANKEVSGPDKITAAAELLIPRPS